MADGLTISVNRIELRDDEQQTAFEQLVYEKVFPALAAVAADEVDRPDDRHLLVREPAAEGDLVYHWIALTGYFIHATPTPTWIAKRIDMMRDTANQMVADFGAFTSEELFYDLRPWLQMMGTIPSTSEA